jgi:hypothetical protein
MTKTLWAAAAAIAVVCASTTAFAQDCEGIGDECYGYKFDDEQLLGGVGGPRGANITLRQSVVRRTLIRPRTNFVPELMKSVEKI